MDPCGPDAGQERGCARPISILAPARPFPARIVEVVMVGGVNRRMHGYAMCNACGSQDLQTLFFI